jgi:DNA-directed RNA polymerase alpha subunit
MSKRVAPRFVCELDLQKRIKDKLATYGIVMVEDLARMTYMDVFSLKGIGIASTWAVQNELLKHGLSLVDCDEDEEVR